MTIPDILGPIQEAKREKERLAKLKEEEDEKAKGTQIGREQMVSFLSALKKDTQKGINKQSRKNSISLNLNKKTSLSHNNIRKIIGKFASGEIEVSKKLNVDEPTRDRLNVMLHQYNAGDELRDTVSRIFLVEGIKKCRKKTGNECIDNVAKLPDRENIPH